MEGRDFVLPDDVKLLADFVLSHRIIVSPSARIKNVTSRQIVEDALRHTPVPGTRGSTCSILTQRRKVRKETQRKSNCKKGNCDSYPS